MANNTDPKAIYANLMDEAKTRIDSIERAISGQFNLHPMLIQEFCYLQLRLLCEGIALGCVVSHGDITKINMKPLSKRDRFDWVSEGARGRVPGTIGWVRRRCLG